MKTKFYNTSWFMWLMLVFIAPVGIFLMWKNNKFNKKPRIVLSVVFALWFIIVGAMPSVDDTASQTNTSSNNTATKQENTNKEQTKETVVTPAPTTTEAPKETTENKVTGELKVHFIDVGQADSILVQQGSQAMLIDAGNNPDGGTVKNYIANQGIKNLDFLVGTHPHEDHIGGLDYVINSFQIGKIYMPKTTATTATFKDVVTAAQNKGLSFNTPNPGDTFKVGEATCTILAPNGSGYEDANNFSIVIKVQYGSTSFLLTGDAEDISENQMISKGFDLSAAVLKVGHHGSDSSTTSNFLNKVNPKYAVISVGKGNTYGHPKQSTMDRLKAKGVAVYRTDENGTIVAVSNGTTVTFNTQPGSYSGNSSANTGGASTSNNTSNAGSSGNTTTPAPAPTPTPPPATNTSADRIVYWTPGGGSYHFRKDCSTLARSKTINEGPLSSCPKTDPCDKCAH